MKRNGKVILQSILLGGLFLLLGCWPLWPWLRTWTRRFDNLSQYRVYEAGRVLTSPQGHQQEQPWRDPKSRLELLARPEHEVQYLPKKQPRRRLPGVNPFLRPGPSTVRFQPGDSLRDFVVHKENHSACPTTRLELNEAIAAGAAVRASDFFPHQFERIGKPFYGQLPTNANYSTAGGALAASPLQIRRDGKWVPAQLETPPRASVFLRAAGGAYNARMAQYEQQPPIAHQFDSFWAAIYIGTSHSCPTAFVIERITVSPTSAEVLIHKPQTFIATCDRHPYWFFIPLGRLQEGRYTITVRDADTGTILCSTDEQLRYATAAEIATRNAESEELQHSSNRTYEQQQQTENHATAQLQVRLERLAEFVANSELGLQDREQLSRDVVELGRHVDCLSDAAREERRSPLRLAPPQVGATPDLTKIHRPPWDPEQTPWGPAPLLLNKVWLCDGSDADFYCQQNYRQVPEFAGALTAVNPTPTQLKIREIWGTLQAQARERSGGPLKTLAVTGDIGMALDAAHRYIVKGVEKPLHAKPGESIWAVIVAKRSFLIRQFLTRQYQANGDPSKRTEFMIVTSAFVRDDGGQPSPVTFGLIELGSQPAGHSLGVLFNCRSICGPRLGADSGNLIDVMPTEMVFSNYGNYLPYGTGLQIEDEPK